MTKDPSLLLHPKYDGLNPRFEKMMVEAGVDVKSAAQPPGVGVSPNVLLAVAGVAGAAALLATNGLSGSGAS